MYQRWVHVVGAHHSTSKYFSDALFASDTGKSERNAAALVVSSAIVGVERYVLSTLSS